MGIKDITELVELIGHYPLRLAAYLVGFSLKQPTDLDDDISVCDIVDDVRHSETAAESSARASILDGLDPPPQQVMTPTEVTWSMLWAYVGKLPGHRFYAVAVAFLSFALTAYTIFLIARNETVPTPIFAGALAGWLALPAAPSVHQAVRRFNFIETAMLWLSALLMIGSGVIELLAQLDGLDAVTTPSRAQWACLGIPMGMIWLGVVLGVVAKFGTTGRRRQLAFPAWVAIAVGCVATYLHTHAGNNLILAIGSLFAALVAAHPRRQ